MIAALSEANAEERRQLEALIALGSTTVDLDAELRRPFARIWVAREASRIAGFLLGWDVADELHVLDLVVEPDSRRRGLGRRLLQASLEHARARQASTVLLEVRKSNHAARSLYAGAGFEPAGERAGYYADGEDAVLMRLDVRAC